MNAKNFAAAAFLPCFFCTGPAGAAENGNTLLDLTVHASVRVVPDMATIGAGVSDSAASPDKAMRDNAAKMAKIMQVLKSKGIADRDIQTSDINVRPQYDYRNNAAPPRIVSYAVSDDVDVVLHDMKDIGPVLDALTAAGANRISGPYFSVAHPGTFLDAARRKAVDKAQKRAALYASATGLKVKRIATITEQDGGGFVAPRPVMMNAMFAKADVVTPVSPGQTTLSVTLDVKYVLAP